MSRAWEPEVDVDPKRALELIQAQCPGVKAEKISVLGLGWDNTAYLVDEKLVFRFPRRQVAVSLIMKEVKALPKIRDLLPVPIPEMKWFGQGDQGWPFSGYPLISGTTACRAHLSDEERRALARPLGEFLRTLHKIPVKIGMECDLPGDLLGSINPEIRIKRIKDSFDEILLLKLLKSEEVEELMKITKTSFRAPEQTAIVHGDFYARHLLVDNDHKLAAVIDWGDIHLGDPALDLAIAHSFLPPDAHEAFRESYGPITQETWTLARLRALSSAAILMVFGHHTQDDAILEEGRRGLFYLLTA